MSKNEAKVDQIRKICIEGRMASKGARKKNTYNENYC